MNKDKEVRPKNSNVKTICAWCGRTLIEGDESLGVSHSICVACAETEHKKLEVKHENK